MRAKGFSQAPKPQLMDKKNTLLSSLTFRYVLALGILAVLSLASYLILKENIKANEGSAAVINISGRQRMFSQRIAFLSLRLVAAQGSEEKEKIRKALVLVAGAMEKSHNSLIKGDFVLELRRMPSPQVQAMYFSPSLNLDVQVRRYLEKARGLLSFSDAEIGLQNPNLQYIIEAAQGDLLNSLDAVVKQYQLESEARIDRLKILQGWVVLSALGVLLITGVFLFRPMLKRIRQKTDALERHEAALIKANELLRQKINESEILARQLRVTNEFDEALLRTIPFGIDIVDTQGTLLYINEKMQHIVGQEALGKKCYLLYKDDKQQCLSCPLKNGIKMGEARDIEVRGVLGGKVFSITHTGMVYQGTQVILEIFEDITGYTHAQEQLALSERLASIGRMAGVIAHEFRNQLAVIRNAAYFLKMKIVDKDEKIQRHLGILDEQVVETERIIENILAFARNKQPELKKEDLRSLLLSSIDRVLIPQGIEVTTRIGNLPLLEIDSVEMSTVFINILLNAVQAMNGNGKLLIEVTKTNNYVTITFKDTGKGIKDEDKKRLFEPFFSTKARGTGLGLATAKIIVQGHKGDVTLESEYGKGAMVTVTLPLSDVSSS